MPTFGETGLGDQSAWVGTPSGTLFRMGSANNGRADSITVLLKMTTTAKKCHCALYDSDNNLVTNGVTEERTVGVHSAFTAETFNFTPTKPELLSGQQYWIFVWAEANASEPSTTVLVKTWHAGYSTEYDFCVDFSYQLAEYPAGFPSSLDPTCADGGVICAYCTYTALTCASYTTQATCEAAGCYWYNSTCNSTPFFAGTVDVYISGFLSRFQKRQIVGYHPYSGDLRSITCNASGHLFTDVEVEVSSGLHVVISGQPVTISGDHVYVESGVWIAGLSFSGLDIQVDISGDPVNISGQPVIISGQHVHLESGDTIDVFVQSGSEASVTTTAASGQGAMSGQIVHIGCASTIRTGKLFRMEGGRSGATHDGSGGISLCSGDFCSGPIHTIIIKNIAGNADAYIGEVNCKPYSGYGFLLAASEAINLDYCNICNIYAYACLSGEHLTWIGTDY